MTGSRLFLVVPKIPSQYGPPLNAAMEPPELPECPVCLQPFDGESTIPRVLACGHSSCEACLLQLPKPPFPSTIRCPACTQLVCYPHPQGPSALPKNIDLLRISSSLIQSNHTELDSSPKKPIVSFPDFIPNLWSHEFYNNWKDWVVPQDTISIDASVALDGSILQGRVVNLKKSSGPSFRCSFKGNHKVGLFNVGSFMDNVEYRFKYSYLAKVMWVLFKMKDVALAELELILTSSLKAYRICTAYGLWFNEEDDHLYLVCERKNISLLNVIVSDLQFDISSLAMIGMELCEAISGLHESELVFGCTSLSCYFIDDFRHVFIDLNEVLMVSWRVQKMITDSVSFAQNDDGKRLAVASTNDGIEIHVFPSPELLVQFVQKEGVDLEFAKSTFAVGYSSDVWSLACILVMFLAGKSFVEETYNFLFSYILALINGNADDCEGLYMAWLDKVSGLLDAKLGSGYVLMKQLLHKCLCFNPGSRPLLADLWECLRELIIKPKFDIMGSSQQKLTNESTYHCLLLGDLSWSSNKTNKVDNEKGIMNHFKGENLVVESDVIEGFFCKDSLKCTDLKGHLDCISGLAIGGGFLFSCSFDKTINVWSLEGYNHVHTFKGHEHKVMAVAFVNIEPPLCISADNGGDIFIWSIKVPFEEKAIKRLNEGKDWRYSGIHALAVSGSGFFYTGSGDKSIKAWSMHDYSLSCSMIGHKAVVSTLAVSNQVLYSGSWDGTIRLWCLNDHTPLAVLGEEASGTLACGSVLSLAADGQTVVAAHENGCIKIWNNDLPLNSVSAHTSSIFSIYMDRHWVFSGGWDKTVVLQKLSSDESGVDVTQIGTITGDSVVTTLLYWQGKLFVGHADRTIKVYSFEG